LSIFTTILASRIGNWQHYLKITSIVQRISTNVGKMNLVFLRIIQRFKIAGRETNNNKEKALNELKKLKAGTQLKLNFA